MPASEITFAEMLKEVGYQTACVGKWDVSNRKAIVERMPNAQGFDYYFAAQYPKKVKRLKALLKKARQMIQVGPDRCLILFDLYHTK